MNHRTSILRALFWAGGLALSPAGFSFQQSLAQPTQPAAASDVGEALRATVTGVEGVVQVRSGPEAPWRKATAGMELGEGAEFRTGPRSAVRFIIPPGQTITLDRLGTVKLIEAVRSATKVKTDLGMQYGRVRYDIEAAGQEHDSTIHSPSSALAVRGTQVSLYDQAPFAPQATSLTGVAQFRNAKRQMIAFGTKGKNKKSEVRSDASSAGETAQERSVINDFAVQQSDQQARELAYLFARQGAAFNNVATSTSPVSDADLPQLLPGRLNFVLRWSSSALQEFSDLNLVVSDSQRESFGNPPFIFSLYPNNPDSKAFLEKNFSQTSASGGFTGLNHIGPEGIEIGSFGSKAPPGTYVVGAYNFFPTADADKAPGPRIPFKIEVFLDGKRQDLVLNALAVLAGKELPVCGNVFEGAVAVGQRLDTIVRIGTPLPCTPPAQAAPSAARSRPVKPIAVGMKENPRSKLRGR